MEINGRGRECIQIMTLMMMEAYDGGVPWSMIIIIITTTTNIYSANVTHDENNNMYASKQVQDL